MHWRGRELWDHQWRGVCECLDAIETCGHKRVVVTSPTGGGKTTMMGVVIDDGAMRSAKTILYTNRRMLLDQTIQVLIGFGLPFGVRAAGHEDLADHTKPIQLAMMQTEQTRLRTRASYELFPADRVLIDECFVGDTPVETPHGRLLRDPRPRRQLVATRQPEC